MHGVGMAGTDWIIKIGWYQIKVWYGASRARASIMSFSEFERMQLGGDARPQPQCWETEDQLHRQYHIIIDIYTVWNMHALHGPTQGTFPKELPQLPNNCNILRSTMQSVSWRTLSCPSLLRCNLPSWVNSCEPSCLWTKNNSFSDELFHWRLKGWNQICCE